MGFAKYKHSNWLSFHDLPDEGAVGTIDDAEESMQENFRTQKKEMRVTLYFKEWKPFTLTNPNLDTLEACFPHMDVTTISGQRIWLNPVTLEIGGETKQVVRIDQLRTMRMLPDPTLDASQAASEKRDEDAPPPTDSDPVHDQEPPPF